MKHGKLPLTEIFITFVGVIIIFVILFLAHYIQTEFFCNNQCCACGSCHNKGIFESCNNCQCIGPDSEACHMAGWKKESPCCNESAEIEQCYEYLDNR